MARNRHGQPTPALDDAGQIMTVAHIIQRFKTVAVRLRQCRLPPSVGRLRLVIESGLAIHFEAILVGDADDARLPFARQCPGSARSQDQAHPSKTAERSYGIPYDNHPSRPPGSPYCSSFDAISLISQYISSLILRAGLRFTISGSSDRSHKPARQHEERCGMPMTETLDRMIFVIRTTLRLVEFHLDETTHVRILGGIRELHVRQNQHRRGRRHHTITATSHTGVHLRTGRQGTQQGEACPP